MHVHCSNSVLVPILVQCNRSEKCLMFFKLYWYLIVRNFHETNYSCFLQIFEKNCKNLVTQKIHWLSLDKFSKNVKNVAKYWPLKIVKLGSCWHRTHQGETKKKMKKYLALNKETTPHIHLGPVVQSRIKLQ